MTTFPPVPMYPFLVQKENDLELQLRVVPKSSRNRFMGVLDDALKLTITAPPVDGAANAAVTAFLSDFCKVSKSRIALIAGETSRSKRFRIIGYTADEFLTKLELK